MTEATGLDILLAFIAMILLAGSWLALLYAHRQRRASGLPAGRVIYADTGDWRPLEKPLYSAAFNLVGRPDYLVSTRAGAVPVEVKSGGAPAQPYASHVLQLAAYCLLVEEAQGKSPSHGLIRYRERTFRVDYTAALRREMLSVMETMRRDLTQAEAPRNHCEPRRCAVCGYRHVCDDCLSS